MTPKKNFRLKLSTQGAAVFVSSIAILASACGSTTTKTGTGTILTDTESTAATSLQAADLASTDTVVLEGEALPAQAGSADPAIGMVAPTLSGTDLNGEPLTIAADGKPKVVYFVAHWCPHCQKEVTAVQSLVDEGKKPAELDIYAVSTAVDETRDNFPPSAWLSNEQFEPQTMRDDANNSAMLAFGGNGFPYAVYLDGSNNVLARTSSSQDRAKIISAWEETATGRAHSNSNCVC